MAETTLRIRNLRGLKSLDWTFGGVCLLAGANGAGKTTVLNALRFLQVASQRGVTQAIQSIGGPSQLKTHGVDTTEPVRVELERGGVRWSIALAKDGPAVHQYHGESVTHDGEQVLTVPMLQPGFELDGRSRQRQPHAEIKTLNTVLQPAWLGAFLEVVDGLRVHGTWNLSTVRDARQVLPEDVYLVADGQNLERVLNIWNGEPRRFVDAFEWVKSQLRRAFPGVVDDLTFFRRSLVIYQPDSEPEEYIPTALMADGVLTALLQLTAVAGAPEGGIVVFDEIENQLHPHAIRHVIRAIRERAEEHDLTVVMTSHSPVVMNTFREVPEQFFVLQPEQGLVSLDELHDEDWLQQFALGDLYDRLEFGQPDFAAEVDPS